MTYYYGPTIKTQTVLATVGEVAFAQQVAGGPLNQYDVVYRDGQFWRRTDANDIATAPIGGPYGVVQQAAASGGTFPVWIRGLISNGAWNFASGLPTWVASGATSPPTQSAPTMSGNVQARLGWAPLPTLMDLNPTVGFLIAQSG